MGTCYWVRLIKILSHRFKFLQTPLISWTCMWNCFISHIIVSVGIVRKDWSQGDAGPFARSLDPPCLACYPLDHPVSLQQTQALSTGSSLSLINFVCVLKVDVSILCLSGWLLNSSKPVTTSNVFFRHSSHKSECDYVLLLVRLKNWFMIRATKYHFIWGKFLPNFCNTIEKLVLRI